MSSTTIPDEVTKLFPMGDAKLKGIRWIEQGVAISLDIPGDGLIELYCDWSRDLRIDLDFGDLAEGLMFTGRLKPADDGGWALDLDFGGAPEGYISLACNTVQLRRGRGAV